MEQKKVKLYNLKSVSDKIIKAIDIKKEEMNKGETKKDFEIIDSFVLIEGKKGIIVSADREGVHTIITNKDREIIIMIRRKDIKTKKGLRGEMFPRWTLAVKLKEILELKPDYKEIDLKDVVRIFGARLDTNYNLLLNSCKEIGLDLKEYKIDRGE